MKRQPRWVWILLPVILAAAVLVLWPVYTTDGTPASRSFCLSHVKQTVLSLVMYVSDADGKMPLRDTWMDSLGPYAKNPEIFHCSEVKDPDLYGYALNARVRNDGVPNPAAMPLVYDSVNFARNASDLFNSLPQAGRHEGMNVIGYLDGHAKAVIAPKAPAK
jgi:hypothetical protein